MHSISPILSKEFDDDDFCILIDVPGGYSPNEKFYEMMGEIAISKNRREAILKLEEMYPEKVDEMRRNYMNFYVTIYRILRPQNDFKT